MNFVAIDFETANKNRISACAIGLVYFENSIITKEKSFFIKPPEGESFSRRHIKIHGITEDLVLNALNFKELWENELSKYLNNNLVTFHNSSMDLSVLKNLFNHYQITNYDIKYIDTMYLASKLGKPKKLSELASLFKIEFSNSHNPKEDAKVCAKVFAELTSYIEKIELYTKTITSKTPNNPYYKDNKVPIETRKENLDFIEMCSIKKEDIDNINIKDTSFLFTGNMNISRDDAQDFIIKNNGIIKKGITSKVDYVVIGDSYGWSKIQKIHETNQKKGSIKILDEPMFNELISRF